MLGLERGTSLFIALYWLRAFVRLTVIYVAFIYAINIIELLQYIMEHANFHVSPSVHHIRSSILKKKHFQVLP